MPFSSVPRFAYLFQLDSLLLLNAFSTQIRSAIEEYQDNLFQKVKEDIDALKVKYSKNYEHSEAASMSRVRNLPEVSGAIIWAKQIQRQLDTYLKRLEDVFGKEWQRLLDNRSENGWKLDQSLADILGVPFAKLEVPLLSSSC